MNVIAAVTVALSTVNWSPSTGTTFISFCSSPSAASVLRRYRATIAFQMISRDGSASQSYNFQISARIVSNRGSHYNLVHRHLPYSVGEVQRCVGDHLRAYTGLQWEVFVQLTD
jgi:hypothetical protein